MLKYLCGAASVALFAVPVAHAQNAVPDTAASEDRDAIIVTALRRETALQKTPVSISVLSGESVEKNGINGIYDLFRRLPNVNITPVMGTQPRLSIRGIQVAGEPTVGLYYDDISITGGSGTTQDSGSSTADLDLFDVKRLELLRGPQGTLYGAGAMTGALKILFNSPTAEKFEGAVEAGYETADDASDGWRLRGMVNVPLIRDTLALRVVASRQVSLGYIDAQTFGRENINASRSTNVRAQLGWTPTPDVQVSGTFLYQKRGSDDAQGWYTRLGAYKNDSVAILPFDSDLRLYSLTANWDIGPAKLTLSGSHYDWEVTRQANLSNVVRNVGNSAGACQGYFRQATACTSDQVTTFKNAGLALLPVLNVAADELRANSIEFRAASDTNGPLAWTVGLYYQDRYDRVDSHFVRGSAQTGEAIQPLDDLALRFIGTKLTQKAAFAELAYTPIAGLTLTGGLRRYDYSKSTEGAVLQSNILVGVSAAPYARVNADAKGWLTKFGADYQVNDDLLLYASAAQGFRPGGANNIPGLSTTLIAYQPDTLWTYEAGLKSSWLDRRLTLNAALYQTDWDNIQVSAQSTAGPFSFISNAGAARVRGGEVEIVAKPVDGVAFNAGFGYADGKLTQDQASSDIVVTGSSGKAGDRLPNSPRVTLNAGLEYDWAPKAGWNAFVRGDAFYRSEMRSTYRPDTDPNFNRYGDDLILSARAGVQVGTVKVTAYVENLTDKKALTSLSSSLFAVGEAYSVPPRTFGLLFGKSF